MTYKDKSIQKQMNEYFIQNKAILLSDFISEKVEVEELKKKSISSKFQKTMYKPLQYKKNIFEIDKFPELRFFKSQNFLEFIKNITQFNLELISISYELYKKQDYSLILDNEDNDIEDSIEVYYDISDTFENNSGGKMVYIQDKKDIFYFEPCFNCLLIYYKDKSQKKFLKYLNSKTGDHKIVRVIIKFRILNL